MGSSLVSKIVDIEKEITKNIMEKILYGAMWVANIGWFIFFSAIASTRLIGYSNK